MVEIGKLKHSLYMTVDLSGLVPGERLCPTFKQEGENEMIINSAQYICSFWCVTSMHLLTWGLFGFFSTGFLGFARDILSLELSPELFLRLNVIEDYLTYLKVRKSKIAYSVHLFRIIIDDPAPTYTSRV